MEIVIKGDPKEIAALVVALQERRGLSTYSFLSPSAISLPVSDKVCDNGLKSK